MNRNKEMHMDYDDISNGFERKYKFCTDRFMYKRHGETHASLVANASKGTNQSTVTMEIT